MIHGVRVVALEEHYADPEVGSPNKPLMAELSDFAHVRLHQMDAAGIDVQILSLAPPGLQDVRGSEALATAIRVNDRLAARIEAAPHRFGGFAALPTAVPEAAADELERCVSDLGCRGAMVHGPTDGLFLDDRRFDPILARAERLGVPLYVHPSPVLEPVREAYLAPYDKTHPMFAHAAWGFTIETGTHAMRMVLGRVFERHPGLQVILGHLGEAIPYLAPRIDEALSRNTPMKTFTEVFRRNFHVTTSGFFSDLSARLCIDFMGIDRVLFSVDWPYASNTMASDWVKAFPMDPDDRAKLLYGNAARLLHL